MKINILFGTGGGAGISKLILRRMAALAAFLLLFCAVTAGCVSETRSEQPDTEMAETTAAASQTTTAAIVAAATTEPAHIEEIADAELDAYVAAPKWSADDGLPPVASVAGHPVSQSEYRYMLNLYKSAMLLNTGIDSGSDEALLFWSRAAANGKTRLDEAREKIFTELHQIKICEDLAENRGITIEQDELENISTDLRAQEDRFGGRDNFIKILSDEYGITLLDYLKISESITIRDLVLDNEKITMTIPEGEIMDYYNRNLDAYGDRAVIRQILFLNEGTDIKKERTADETKVLAEETLEALLSGADIESLATEKSEEPGAALNGGARIVTRDDSFTPAEVLDWVFSADTGESSVINTSFGYYVVRLEEHIYRSYSDVKPDIEDVIKNRLLAERIAGWMKDPAYAMDINREVLDSIA